MHVPNRLQRYAQRDAAAHYHVVFGLQRICTVVQGLLNAQTGIARVARERARRTDCSRDHMYLSDLQSRSEIVTAAMGPS